MGSDGLQVALDQLGATATQWQGISAQFTAATPPPPGQPFQATTAAVSSINALISTEAAGMATRSQDTAGQVTNAAAGYGRREATSAGEMAEVPKVTIV